MQVSNGMNGSEGIVSGNLCFAPLDDRELDAPFELQIVSGPGESSAPRIETPADTLERLLDRYGVRGRAVCAANLEETPDDRGGYALVMCRVREPIAA